jgi:DNA-binding transcriptional MerR regulator
MHVGWSTREVAEIAGTTVNTVRHYHRLGLLELPERAGNGYKQYEVRHLVCLLRIRRLVGLGVPLNRIGDVSARDETTQEALRDLDAELGATIERLQHARADIQAIMAEQSPADIAAGFETVGARLSEADSSMIHLYGRVFDEQALADVRQMTEDDDAETGAEIDALAPDADDATRQRLAEALAPSLAKNFVDYPWLRDPAARIAQTRHVTEQTFVEALTDLYNPAQLDVFVRASVLAQQRIAPGPTEAEPGA